MVVFRLKRLYSCKVVVFGIKWLFSDKSGCIWARKLRSGTLVVLGQKWTYSGKSVVFELKCLYSANWLYFCKVVVFGQSGCIWAKVVVLVQKLLYSGKVFV